jgi:hypothetical protein
MATVEETVQQRVRMKKSQLEMVMKEMKWLANKSIT